MHFPAPSSGCSPAPASQDLVRLPHFTSWNSELKPSDGKSDYSRPCNVFIPSCSFPTTPSPKMPQKSLLAALKQQMGSIIFQQIQVKKKHIHACFSSGVIDFRHMKREELFLTRPVLPDP